MKRDFKVIQYILEILEEGVYLSETKDIQDHLLILEDAGYVTDVESRGTIRLTWAGHEALLRDRSGKRWS